MKNLNGKYIWIVGASSGIGAALAKELSHRGAKLAISARREEKLQEIRQELKGDGHVVAALDVTNPKEIEDAKAHILQTMPRIDSTIYLAAIYKDSDTKEMSLDFVNKILQVNIGGAYAIINALMPLYKNQGQGQLVLCGSVAGYRGLPNGQPYSSTKAALINLAESMKLEAEDDNIDVKLICPGFVKTDLTDQNDFEMPFIIEPEEAAKEIAKGLTSKSFEIHFPKKLTLIMKLLRILPNALYFMAARNLKPD